MYALLASNEDIARAENIDMLVDLAEKMNFAKQYYAKHILQEIADELQYVIKGTYVLDKYYIGQNIYKGELDNPGMEFIDDIYSFDEWYGIWNELHGTSEREQSDPKIRGRALDAYWNSIMSSISLKGNTLKDIGKIVSELRSGKLSSSIAEKAIYYFTNLPWAKGYGGPVWASIVYWTKKLIDTPPINIELLYANPKQAYRQMIGLATILDTIHSLEHNTNMVLSDLPEGAGEWMRWVLDLMKYAVSPLGVAYLGGNPSLTREIKEQYMVNQQYEEQPKTIEEFLLRTLSNMEDYRKQIFLRKVNDPRILSILVNSPKVPVDALTYLIANPHIYKVLSDKDLSRFYHRLVENIGYDNFAKHLVASNPNLDGVPEWMIAALEEETDVLDHPYAFIRL